LPAIPVRSNVTLLRENAIEQNESHDAADVDHDYCEDEAGDHNHRDQAYQNRGVDFRHYVSPGRYPPAALMRWVKTPEIEISTGAQFARKQANDG
jgi:hypothetical protein